MIYIIYTLFIRVYIKNKPYKTDLIKIMKNLKKNSENRKK